MGSGFAKKKKEAKLFREQFEKMQEKLKTESVTGTSEGGLIEVTLNGEFEMPKISIKPECVDPEDIEGLEDLIKSAYEDARKKIQNTSNLQGMPDLSSMGF